MPTKLANPAARLEAELRAEIRRLRRVGTPDALQEAERLATQLDEVVA